MALEDLLCEDREADVQHQVSLDMFVIAMASNPIADMSLIALNTSSVLVPSSDALVTSS